MNLSERDIISLNKTPSQPPVRMSWLLVEVNEGSKAEYYSIHTVEILSDYNTTYVNRKVRFSQQHRQLTGVVRLASDDIEVIETERKRLRQIQRICLATLDPLKVELWCLVRQTTDDTMVRLITVSCKKLICIESTDINRKHFLMEKGESQIPITLLHIIDSEHQLFEEMEFLNSSFANICLCEEKDRAVEAKGLEKAFLLVQYFEDSRNLIHTIVRYKDTIYQKGNHFPNEIAYITDDEGLNVKQCIILRKSFDRDELSELLLKIKEFCDNINYPLLHAKLKKSLVINGENSQKGSKKS